MIVTRGYGVPFPEITVTTRGYGFSLSFVSGVVREVWRGISRITTSINLVSRLG